MNSRHRDYVNITAEKFCHSEVGRKGGQQILSLTAECIRGSEGVGAIIHELMHTIGFYHEQSRTDRDNYVTIHMENVLEDAKTNFDTYDLEKITQLGTSYDYESILHYDMYAFSKNGQPTIVPKKPGVTIGQRKGFSSLDIYKINKFYECGIESQRSLSASCDKQYANFDIDNRFDLCHKPGESSDCCHLCTSTKGCKAYAWSYYIGGMCTLKSAGGPTINNENAKMGTLNSDNTCTQHKGTDIIGHDLEYRIGQEYDCCKFCEETKGCKAYTYDTGRRVRKRPKWIFAIVERGSGLSYLRIVRRRNAATLIPIIFCHVRFGSNVMTDEWQSYRRLQRLNRFRHRAVNHGLHFVDPTDPAVHTQTIKNKNDIVKQTTGGAWHVAWFGLYQSQSGLSYYDKSPVSYNVNPLPVAPAFNPGTNMNCFVLMLNPDSSQIGWQAVNCNSTTYIDGFVCTSPPRPPPPSCPNGWHYYQQTRKCFYIEGTPLVQAAARNECSKRNGTLASISNSDENVFVANIVKQTTGGAWHVAWFGLYQSQSGLSYYDKSPVSYNVNPLPVAPAFNPGTDMNCFVLMLNPDNSQIGWQDVNCNSTTYIDGFVCSQTSA
uniref:Metalloendopeptidase n=1 Tax=Acrobeloides nanus TaxID=290746 RepID=A0A914DVI8_9BILA